MDLWMIIVLAVVLILIFIIVGMRSLHRENRNEMRSSTPESFGDDPEPPAAPHR